MKIQESKSGKVLQTAQGYAAYIPNPLPPKIIWSNALITTLSRADYQLGQLAQEGNKLPNPHLLMRPFITREAVLSSKIEGTQATIGEILAYEAGIPTEQHQDELQEVQNYVKALEFGINRLQQLPLSLRLIREIHYQLMQGVRGAHATPGEFRKSQNWIGAPGCTLNSAKFVPPPPEYLMECLCKFEEFLYDRQFPALIQIALCHYQLEAIHPFLDGNGRVGRLLILLLLIERKVLPSPLLYLSAFFEATREEYYRQLLNVSTQGTWEEWLLYFLNGIALQTEDTLSRAERINTLLTQWKIQVPQNNSRFRESIIDYLAINPYLTIRKLAERLKISYTTAKRDITQLLDAGIITQTKGKKRDKIYCATKILTILEEPAKIGNNFENVL